MLDMSAAHVKSSAGTLYAIKKQIITSSHIAASNNLVPERWGPPFSSIP
jgi:hypothetical protein